MFTWLKKITTTAVLLSLSCFAFADPPLESGVVTRFDEVYWSWWVDEDSDSTIYLGVDPYVACFAEFPQGFDFVPVMRVFMQTDGEDVIRFKDHIVGDVQVYVYSGFSPPGVLCAQIFFGLDELIASGMAHFVFNDNDVVPSLNPDRRNMNTFGFNTNGHLFNATTGERMRFMMFWHAAWDGQDPASFREKFKFKLK